MTKTPERIWIDAWGGHWSPRAGGTQGLEYVPAARLAEVEAERDRLLALVMDAHGASVDWASVCKERAATELSATPTPEAVKPREFGPPYELTHTDGEWWTLKAHGFVVATYSLKSWGSADKIIEAAWQHAYGQPAPVTPEVGALVEASARDVLKERQRQVSVEGWRKGHDDGHCSGELAVAAACYALSSAGWGKTAIWEIWPKSFGVQWFKPTDHRRDLVKAGALILAEIERLDRAAVEAHHE